MKPISDATFLRLGILDRQLLNELYCILSVGIHSRLIAIARSEMPGTLKRYAIHAGPPPGAFQIN
jgi:hypothetical protein